MHSHCNSVLVYQTLRWLIPFLQSTSNTQNVRLLILILFIYIVPLSTPIDNNN